MLYRKMATTGDNLSVLGFGCMRFPRKNGSIDAEKVEQLVRYAITQGVNYFDTAYLYPGSEEVLGNILAKGLRDQVYIATKLPVSLLKNSAEVNTYFQTQIDRLQTKYIDYYLMHNLNSLKDWQYLKQLGIEKFIRQEKLDGRIRNIGFSFHGNINDFKEILNDFPWDFCQMQYNYMDENYQVGKQGLLYAYEKGIPVVIMEPLRGGTLSGKLPQGSEKYLEQTTRSQTELALQWVWDHKEVTLLLSGMNEESQVVENINSADKAYADSLTKQELSSIESIRKAFMSKTKTPCTGCSYCIPCPAGVNIPYCFSMHNAKSMFNGFFPVYQYLSTDRKTRASNCMKCGKCEKHCPQQIEIRQQLQSVATDMEKGHYRFIVRMIVNLRKIMLRR